MNNFFLTNKAVADLTSIWEYTFSTWSESQADKYYHQLLSNCKLLANNTSLGKTYPEINDEIFGYRSGQHILFFRISNSTTIEITRILHSRMDLKARIEE